MSRIRSAATGTGTKKKAPSAAQVSRLQKKVQSLTAQKDRLNAVKKKVAANAKATGAEVVHLGETALTAGLSSALSGYAGDKRKHYRIGRGIGAALLGGWGLLSTLNGKNGGHQLAVASGLVAAEASEAGMSWGQELAAKRAAPASATGVAGEASAAGPGPVQGVPEVALTPGANQLGDAGIVRNLLPEDPMLADFRARALARAGVSA